MTPHARALLSATASAWVNNIHCAYVVDMCKQKGLPRGDEHTVDSYSDHAEVEDFDKRATLLY